MDDNTTNLKESLLPDNQMSADTEKDQRKELARTYSENAPKILLETISARTAQIILISTYIIFIFGFIFDLRDTLHSFEDGNRALNAISCDKSNVTIDTVWRKPGDWGCTFDLNKPNPLWIGHIDDLTNVISVELQVRQLNVTKLHINGSDVIITPDILDGVYFYYDVFLYGCYDKRNCQWQTVLSLKTQMVEISQIYRAPENAFVLNTFSNTFQNQEALPNKGKVKSYIAIVNYYGVDYGVFDGTQEITYEFLMVTRPETVKGNMVLIFLLTVTTFTSILYYRAVYSVHPVVRKWLPEQKWLVWYFFALIVYQNPVYCWICWQSQPSSLAVFTSYVFDAFGQAAFFVIWLLFSDGLRRKSNYFLFYIPKFCIGFLIFAANLAVLMLQFPSITPIDNRSPLLSVNNWSDELKLVFICTSIGFLALMVIWITWWLYTLWSTGRTLQRLPYMSTRYLQLSFRFFALQATLVALFYVFQYMAVIFLILRNSPLTQNLTSLTDNINTLFRLQTQLIGRQIFLTVYALTLAFLFLPAGLMDIHAVAFAAAYVINEDEIKEVVKHRRKAIKSMQALSQLAHAKCEVFCVDLALNLLDVAWEAYHDPKGLESESGYGPMDLDRYGYTLVDYTFNEDHDSVCLIARHKTLNRIVVAFRGTSSKRHWSDNLNYTQKSVDMSSIGLTALDQTDGLGDEPTPAASFLMSHTAEGWPYDPYVDDVSDAPSDQHPNLGVAILESAQQVGDGIKKMASTVVGVTIGATTDLLVSAVAHTPGLKFAVQTYVHSGFWEAYLVVREFVHRTLRQELIARPAQVFFTGHSLGGALATLAAVDVSLHSLPRINAYLNEHDTPVPSPFHDASPLQTSTKSDPISPTDAQIEANDWMERFSFHATEKDSKLGNKRKPHHISSGGWKRSNPQRIKASLYNFGSPRVGNWMFAQLTERVVPTSFRVVVDGDIVTAVPPPTMGYKHGGTEVIIDSIGAGSIIVDPSFVERRLRTQSKSSVRVHSLLVYRKGLIGVKESAEFMRSYARELPEDQAVDTVRLALFAGPLIPEAVSSRFRSFSSHNDDAYNMTRMRLPTHSNHSSNTINNCLDVSIDNESYKSREGYRSGSDNAIKKSEDETKNNMDDSQYGESHILHHNDDVKATEDMVTHWQLQQSLRVVPFRKSLI